MAHRIYRLKPDNTYKRTCSLAKFKTRTKEDWLKEHGKCNYTTKVVSGTTSYDVIGLKCLDHNTGFIYNQEREVAR